MPKMSYNQYGKKIETRSKCFKKNKKKFVQRSKNLFKD